MTVKKRISHIVGLTKDIVRTTETTSNTRATALATTSDEITNLWKADYGRALRAILSKSEVREISAEGKRKAWPHLNEDAVRLGSMSEFAERASSLGADFRVPDHKATLTLVLGITIPVALFLAAGFIVAASWKGFGGQGLLCVPGTACSF